MALSFDFSKVRDYQAVTTNPRNPDEWHPVADALVWMSMICGYNAITEKNHAKIASRILAYQKASQPYLGIIKEGKRVDILITARDVERFIGMTTNASTMTDAQWERHVGKIVIDNSRWLDTEATPTALSTIGEHQPTKETPCNS